MRLPLLSCIFMSSFLKLPLISSILFAPVPRSMSALKLSFSESGVSSRSTPHLTGPPPVLEQYTERRGLKKPLTSTYFLSFSGVHAFEYSTGVPVVLHPIAAKHKKTIAKIKKFFIDLIHLALIGFRLKRNVT